MSHNGSQSSKKYQTPPFKYCTTSQKSSKEFVMNAVSQNGLDLEYAEYRDVDVMVAAVKQNWRAASLKAIQKWSNPGVDDCEVLSAVVVQGLRAIRSVQKNIDQASYETTLSLVQQNGSVLEFLSVEYKSDAVIVQAAVKQTWKALRHASDDLKDNFKIVMSAVKQHGGGAALRYVSMRLRGNRDIVFEAVKRDGGALKFASDTLKNDYTIVLTAVKQVGNMLSEASDTLKDNHEIVFAAVTVDSRALPSASSSIQNGSMHQYVTSVVSRYTLSPAIFLSAFMLPLRASSSQNNENSNIALLKLNHLGDEAVLDFLKAIADYAGVRVGERWNAMFDAHMNMCPHRRFVGTVLYHIKERHCQ